MPSLAKKNGKSQTLFARKKGRSIITPDDKRVVTSLDRRMTVEKGVVDELLLVCGVIGTTTNEGDSLIPVKECLNWLQDLQRALRRDDDLYRPISLLIGKWKVVEQKLLPLVVTCRYDSPIVLTIVKILVILTKPLAENTKRAGRMIIDTSSKSNRSVVQEQIKLRENALEQAQLLMEYKRIFSHHPSHHRQETEGSGLLSIFVSLLAEPLSRVGASRTDEDHLTIELVLHLFRNLLSAEPLLNTSTDTLRQSNQLHQELITLFEKELVLEILLVVGQELELRENSQYNLLLMELLHHLLKSQDPIAVSRSNHDAWPRTSSKASTTSKSSRLASKLKLEKSSRRELVGVRHGHFGGTWMNQLNDGKTQYVTAGASSAHKERLEVNMRRNRKAEPFVGSGKHLLAHSAELVTDDGPTSRRANVTLHNFCLRFVEDCYGPVMKSLKNEFRRDSVRLEVGDKVIFFRLIWFFCQWSRMSRRNKSIGQLIFTMDVFTFNLVLNATDTFYQHKKHAGLAQAVALYSEMMLLLYAMQKSDDITENDIALGLLNRLYFVNEPLDRLPKLLSRWTPGTNTREYLCDLCELCHVSLKLLEGSSGDDSDDKHQSKASSLNNNVRKMKTAAKEFDAKSYFCRKIVSNQLVTMYAHLLGQYKLNSATVNNHVVAMFTRLSRAEIASPDIQDPDSPINMLGLRQVTYEPILFNIHVFLVVEKILNDCTIQNMKQYSPLVNFCSSHMYNFLSAAQKNPMAYVECLFRHLAPNRFCESFVNSYVSEELRMVAEREILLDQNRRETLLGDGGNGDFDQDEEVEFTGESLEQIREKSLGLSDSEAEEEPLNTVLLDCAKEETNIESQGKRGICSVTINPHTNTKTKKGKVR
eukprot:scaffold5517_cov135-Cylindrotheca_fusiformis.AAC.29